MISAFGIDHGDVAKAVFSDQQKKTGYTGAALTAGGVGAYQYGRDRQIVGARKTLGAMRSMTSLDGLAALVNEKTGPQIVGEGAKGLKMLKRGKNFKTAGITAGAAGIGAMGTAAYKSRKKKG